MRIAGKALPMILILALALTGCAAPPDQTVAKFLDALKAVNSEELAKYVVEGSMDMSSTLQPDDPIGAETLKNVFGRMTYTMGKAAVNGDTASVPVSITCVDMASVFGSVMTQSMGMAFAAAFSDETAQEDIQALFEQMLVNALKDPKAPMTTQDVTLSLKKVQGKWLVAFGDEKSKTDFANAITGGLGSLAEAFNQTGE